MAVATAGHRPALPYEFTAVDEPEVNAFALPGGYIYITRGLLAYINTEAELAAVLGHEIGHVTARHAVRQQSAATVTGLLGSVLAAGVGELGEHEVHVVAARVREHDAAAGGARGDRERPRLHPVRDHPVLHGPEPLDVRDPHKSPI